MKLTSLQRSTCRVFKLYKCRRRKRRGGVELQLTLIKERTTTLRFTKLILTLFLVATCFSIAAQTTSEIILPDSNLVFKKGNIEGVIFGSNFKMIKHNRIDSAKSIIRDPLKIIAQDEKTKRYIPTIETAIQIEKELKLFIHDTDTFIADSLPMYVKQYFGYVTSVGDTIIYVNCFFDDEIKQEDYWKNSFVKVNDGWHYYFNVKYNLTKKRFFDLWINGFG
jgi:hypothetical protein